MERRFDAAFQADFADLLAWRRDVRRFRAGAVPEASPENLLRLAAFAPSVGNCQPTVSCGSTTRPGARRCAPISRRPTGMRSAPIAASGRNSTLKLAGLREAPVQLAVFCDEATEQGFGLGARTMPETRRCSAVCALCTFWLAARAYGLGVGWVSILEPAPLAEALEVPREWSFVGYFCVGWPQEEHLTPELERAGWQARAADPVIRR
jgi:5,6-dimethylbenzimidazole synthase